MKNCLYPVGVLLVIGLAGCQTSGGGPAWICTATGLINANYNGSEYAQIHLQGYSTGGSYKVALNEQRTEATGTTGNGTPFKCMKAK